MQKKTRKTSQSPLNVEIFIFIILMMFDVILTARLHIILDRPSLNRTFPGIAHFKIIPGISFYYTANLLRKCLLIKPQITQTFWNYNWKFSKMQSRNRWPFSELRSLNIWKPEWLCCTLGEMFVWNFAGQVEASYSVCKHCDSKPLEL